MDLFLNIVIYVLYQIINLVGYNVVGKIQGVQKSEKVSAKVVGIILRLRRVVFIYDDVDEGFVLRSIDIEEGQKAVSYFVIALIDLLKKNILNVTKIRFSRMVKILYGDSQEKPGKVGLNSLGIKSNFVRILEKDFSQKENLFIRSLRVLVQIKSLKVGIEVNVLSVFSYVT